MSNKILAGLVNTASFLRIIDENNKLSLTNIGVIIVLIKLGVSNDVISPIDISALIGTLLSYQAKRHINAQTK